MKHFQEKFNFVEIKYFQNLTKVRKTPEMKRKLCK